jgi:PAS domain S-box-containing protein
LRLWGRAIESSVNAILITDAQVQAIRDLRQPAFERITGYSQEEALGRNRFRRTRTPASPI